MLQINYLTKEYGKVLANDNISFTVNDGEIAVLAGPNGAGKSTVIKCISGLLRFKGQIFIDGHPNKTVEAKEYSATSPKYLRLSMFSPLRSTWNLWHEPTAFPIIKRE